MEWLVNNWYIVFAAIVVVVMGVVVCVKFFKLPTAEQIKAVKEWLVYCVMVCEKELGTKTGKEKLRMAYDMFLSKFTWLAKIVPFDTFSNWVDEALIEFKKMLESNAQLQNYVEE